MTARSDRLAKAIPPGRSVLVDTSVVLAYLGGAERTSGLAGQLFDAFAATGRNPAAMSTVTVAEILVRPFRSGAAAVATAEGFLRHFADLRRIDVTYEVAREAARIRARTDLGMPDALILASAVVADIDLVVANDRSWQARVGPLLPDMSILVLTDLMER